MKSLFPILIALLVVVLGSLELDAQQRQRRGRGGAADENALKVGQEAPNFVLKSLDGESETDLSSFRGQKPVVLFFGSYT